MTPSGTEPATFQLVAQCLNKQRYRVPPLRMNIKTLIQVQNAERDMTLTR